MKLLTGIVAAAAGILAVVLVCISFVSTMTAEHLTVTATAVKAEVLNKREEDKHYQTTWQYEADGRVYTYETTEALNRAGETQEITVFQTKDGSYRPGTGNKRLVIAILAGLAAAGFGVWEIVDWKRENG
ncbi:MAG: hypothetical protein IKX19_09865 [Clostridia bacterium]|nr:hypothetical protein [Clostridia bacterium]